MFDTAAASNGVKFALLEGQLLTREIDRATFIERAADLGPPAQAVAEAADKFMAIAANQPSVPARPAQSWRDAWPKTRMRTCFCSKRAVRI